MLALLATFAAASALRAHEKTPENWKELPENVKLEYIRRNYGDVVTAAPAVVSTSNPEVPAQVPQRVNRGPVQRAQEQTPEDWKDRPEQVKYDYLRRNYGFESAKQ